VRILGILDGGAVCGNGTEQFASLGKTMTNEWGVPDGSDHGAYEETRLVRVIGGSLLVLAHHQPTGAASLANGSAGKKNPDPGVHFDAGNENGDCRYR
jgi:hypothetical protein